MLKKENGAFPDEVICSDSEIKELFDYSTNLLGCFLPEDNELVLIGDNKKYFYTYWDFSEKVDIPVYQQDFKVDEERCFFVLPIEYIHRKICLPCPIPPKKPHETLTAIVVHTPTNSNFWHFSICWKDGNGEFAKYKGAAWQKRILSTLRATLQQLIDTEMLESFAEIPEEAYIKS